MPPLETRTDPLGRLRSTPRSMSALERNSQVPAPTPHKVLPSVTLLLQLERKAHVQAPTRDEDLLPWGDSRSAPRYMSAMERNPQVLAQTPHKILGPGIDGRGIQRGP